MIIHSSKEVNFVPSLMKAIILISFFLCSLQLAAQDSSSFNKPQSMDTVVITATRQPVRIENIAVPLTIISQKQITQTGTVKLSELLQEQSGMFITNGSGSKSVGGGVFGNGIQLQGMSPDHVLILIDGEPVNGKQGGTLDLSRLPVGNVKSIEIVKGPFSSMYGSDAMGGVINIVTEIPKTDKTELALRMGSFSTVDVQAKSFLNKNRTSAYLFVNGYTTKGYDLNKSDVEKTVEAQNNGSVQAKIIHQVSPKMGIIFNNRFFAANQQSRYAIGSSAINIEGKAITSDFASNVKLDYKPTARLNSVLSLFANKYYYSQHLDSIANAKLYYADNFSQTMLRGEQINYYTFSEKIMSIAGVGFTRQSVATNRYNATKHQNAFHFFLQNEIKPMPQLNISVGARYDFNSAYKACVNPKVAVSYQLTKRWRVLASAGSGFKAPDFRQLYLNFINNAADNYTIYGSEEFSIEELKRQQSAGFIADILPAAYSITTLNPEKSHGYNLELQYKSNRSFKASVHAFYNDVNNLIQYIEVAKRPNGASVFSYININRAFTSGIDADIFYYLNKNLNISASYQYLTSGDKDLINQLNAGKIYGRSAIMSSAKLMTRKDYQNLQGRSRHTANIKFVFTRDKFSANTRLLYRSKWGVIDYDGNGFANMNDEYAKGFIQLNMGASYRLNNILGLQAGVNNVTNYTDAIYLTNVPARNYFLTVNINIQNKK